MNPKKLIVLVGVAGALNFAYTFAAPLVEVSWHAYQSTTWPRTSGEVMRSTVEHGRGGRPHAEVLYTYTVEGQPYQSHRVQFAGPAQDEAAAQAMSARYAVGTTVTVFYKPAAPDEAVLMPGLGSYIPIFMLAAGSLAVAGVLASLLRVWDRDQFRRKSGP